MKICLADFNIDFHSRFHYPQILFADYTIADDAEIDMEIGPISLEKIENSPECARGLIRGYAESTLFFREFAERLPLKESLLLHGALFEVDKTGILLSALSGTGKTTHMMLWQKLLGDRLTVINGDKPIIRFLDNHLLAYGTPWNGKEHYGCNRKTQLKHICFIERSENNFVEKISPAEAAGRIMQQVYVPQDPAALAATFPLINRLLEKCDLWIIHCNMEIQAAQIAYNTLLNELGKEELS